MGYHHTKALVLALFCLIAVSTLFTTTTANVVSKGEGQKEEETLVAVDTKKGSRKVLNEKTMESAVGKATNDQEILSFEDEKYYGHGHGGYHHGGGGYHHGGYGHGGHGGYGHGGHSGYGHGGHGGYGHGGHRHGCYHC
ncbi:hypothetical protein ZOSMA_1G03610 [Zostera marina]|uniref:Glycine-rich protein n=1 Tax=Zostera marina TaxID=29655 RepID=A0A0K9PMS9_ZOSMR|nr:hypothetical protein ZOSMA_1G03610 [Zostera marina]